MVMVVVMMVVVMPWAKAHNNTAMMMVVVMVMMADLHRDLRDLRLRRLIALGIFSLELRQRIGHRIEKIAVTCHRRYFRPLRRRGSLRTCHCRQRCRSS
jgi:hypothetical protein